MEYPQTQPTYYIYTYATMSLNKVVHDKKITVETLTLCRIMDMQENVIVNVNKLTLQRSQLWSLCYCMLLTKKQQSSSVDNKTFNIKLTSVLKVPKTKKS